MDNLPATTRHELIKNMLQLFSEKRLTYEQACEVLEEAISCLKVLAMKAQIQCHKCPNKIAGGGPPS